MDFFTKTTVFFRGKNYVLFYMSKVRTFLHDVIFVKTSVVFYREKLRTFLLKTTDFFTFPYVIRFFVKTTDFFT